MPCCCGVGFFFHGSSMNSHRNSPASSAGELRGAFALSGIAARRRAQKRARRGDAIPAISSWSHRTGRRRGRTPRHGPQVSTSSRSHPMRSRT
jgi:hypothetical protein